MCDTKAHEWRDNACVGYIASEPPKNNMELIIIFNPLNEIRKAKGKEWYKDSDGDFILAEELTCGEYPIYERIEIIPTKGATEMVIYSVEYSLSSNHTKIKLHVPKVKKWKWEYHIPSACGYKYTSTMDKLYTEKEMIAGNYPLGEDAWHRVEGSEVEE
jgi:hypothetical protein